MVKQLSNEEKTEIVRLRDREFNIRAISKKIKRALQQCVTYSKSIEVPAHCAIKLLLADQRKQLKEN